jgi:hypothetical protein
MGNPGVRYHRAGKWAWHRSWGQDQNSRDHEAKTRASWGKHQNTGNLTSLRPVTDALEKSSSSPPAFASHPPCFTYGPSEVKLLANPPLRLIAPASRTGLKKSSSSPTRLCVYLIALTSQSGSSCLTPLQKLPGSATQETQLLVILGRCSSSLFKIGIKVCTTGSGSALSASSVAPSDRRWKLATGDDGAFAAVGWFVESYRLLLEGFVVAGAGVGEGEGGAADGGGVAGRSS